MSATGAMPNSFDPERAGDLPLRTRDLITRRRSLLGPGYKLFYERPLEIVRGEGVLLYDQEGEVYLDAYNNVPGVGHCHPHVVAAITNQAQTVNTNTRYLAEPILDYAERLLATHDDLLANVMFTCTGSEATDLALRVARYVTGGTGVVVTANAYHGVTATAAAVSPSLGPNAALGVDVRTVVPPSASEGAQAGASFASDVADAIADLDRHGIKTAAILMDTVFSSDGLVVDPAGFLKPVVGAAHAAGALFIADEVQAGFGRTGAGMWGYQRHGIGPDLVTMGKPMGNGMPIAAVAARPELFERFGNEIRYFNTFGGNSVAIAAAAAVLDVLEREELIANARNVGDYLRAGMSKLCAGRAGLGEVRGEGLCLAVDFVDSQTGEPDPTLASSIINGLRDRHVLVSGTGPTASTLKVRPPLPFARGDAEQLLAALDESLIAHGR